MCAIAVLIQVSKLWPMGLLSYYRPLFRDSVIQFVHYVGCSRDKDPSWMLLLPVAHFLTDSSSPFLLPKSEVGHDYQQPVWWGNCVPWQGHIDPLSAAFSSFLLNKTGWKM